MKKPGFIQRFEYAEGQCDHSTPGKSTFAVFVHDRELTNDHCYIFSDLRNKADFVASHSYCSKAGFALPGDVVKEELEFVMTELLGFHEGDILPFSYTKNPSDHSLSGTKVSINTVADQYPAGEKLENFTNSSVPKLLLIQETLYRYDIQKNEYVIFNPKLNPHEAVPFDEPAVELGRKRERNAEGDRGIGILCLLNSYFAPVNALIAMQLEENYSTFCLLKPKWPFCNYPFTLHIYMVDATDAKLLHVNYAISMILTYSEGGMPAGNVAVTQQQVPFNVMASNHRLF
ncbi:unnamed protein product [Enterobius vermicularis]|uniref:Fe2OG dioxygenase domain-containing protein n=1 Tax=Enterobius vermicularis TaxID=51028 RepID=A0A0N4VE07_ENTVE|nr:unnamed protein product [Enterobius vermicularis]